MLFNFSKILKNVNLKVKADQVDLYPDFLLKINRHSYFAEENFRESLSEFVYHRVTS